MKKKTAPWRKSKDPADRLINAADVWLKYSGGEGLIAGPICIVSEPYESEQKFIVGVKIFGKRPPKVEDNEKLISERAEMPLHPDTEYLMKYIADQYERVCLNERIYGDCARHLEGRLAEKPEDRGLQQCASVMADAQTLVSLLHRFEKK